MDPGIKWVYILGWASWGFPLLIEPPSSVPWSAGWGGEEELVRYLRTCGTRPLEKVKSGVIWGRASGVRQGNPRAILTRVLFTRSGWFGRNIRKSRSRQARRKKRVSST